MKIKKLEKHKTYSILHFFSTYILSTIDQMDINYFDKFLPSLSAEVELYSE